MIFYFTGTGNSLWVARQLHQKTGESVYYIPDLLKNNQTSFSLDTQEKVFFVFPIHSWGPPSIVTDFISCLQLSGYTSQPVYSICTCGDDCGYTTAMFRTVLNKQGYVLSGSYSITMPNNYTLFPGFDVDSDKVEKKKLKEAPERLDKIVKAIYEESKSEELYVEGTIPFIKSRIINPLFIKFVLGKTSFHINSNCISCGLCKKVCPTETVAMSDGHPVWGENCIQCLACLNRCPVRAIDYGKVTLEKGRYCHPDLK